MKRKSFRERETSQCTALVFAALWILENRVQPKAAPACCWGHTVEGTVRSSISALQFFHVGAKSRLDSGLIRGFRFVLHQWRDEIVHGFVDLFEQVGMCFLESGVAAIVFAFIPHALKAPCKLSRSCVVSLLKL